MAEYARRRAGHLCSQGKSFDNPGGNDAEHRTEAPHLSTREKKLLNKHTKSIINQLLRDPILKVKEFASEADAEEKLALFTQIFDIEEAAFPDGENQDERQPVHAFKRQNQQGLTSIASE